MSADLTTLALVFAWLSLTSFGGGNIAIPEIQRQAVLVHGWVTESQFAQAFALSRAAPGPSTLFVFLVGAKTAGWAGAAVASFAMFAPGATLMAGVSALLRRWERRPGVERLLVAMRPITIGMVFAACWVIARSAVSGPLTLGVFLAAAALLSLSRVPVLWVLGGAALAGALAA